MQYFTDANLQYFMGTTNAKFIHIALPHYHLILFKTLK
jgi:hypothetical protein